MTGWIGERLRDPDNREWVRERWRRIRGKAGDPAYAGGEPPECIDGMVSFYEVFPWERREVGVAAPASSMKVGRNAPCLCGSGMKYERCCGSPSQTRPPE